MIDLIANYPFVLPSFIAGILIALLCSVLSVYVVLRRMAFIGQGIGHAAFGGVALGLWLVPTALGPLDWRVYLIAVVFCLANAIAIGLIVRHTELSEDSAIGILFVLSMALGAVFFSLRQERVADLFSYLFGSVVAVTWGDVWLVAGLTAVVLGCLIVFAKELLYVTFDEESARIAGLPADLINHMLLALLSLTIVVAVKIVGVVLVNATLVLPGATARLIAQSFGRFMTAAIVIGVITMTGGLVLANVVDIPAGSAIVLFQAVVFAALWILTHLCRG